MRSLLLAVAIAALASCGGGGSDTDLVAGPAPASSVVPPVDLQVAPECPPQGCQTPFPKECEGGCSEPTKWTCEGAGSGFPPITLFPIELPEKLPELDLSGTPAAVPRMTQVCVMSFSGGDPECIEGHDIPPLVAAVETAAVLMPKIPKEDVVTYTLECGCCMAGRTPPVTVNECLSGIGPMGMETVCADFVQGTNPVFTGWSFGPKVTKLEYNPIPGGLIGESGQ